ncbi:uncharacterized protein LOC132379744 [Hypanus sabinus]|uniref:uncharacterized protein LOC132379744 n=1 Tax=Hypanus sabinus TaxID=79690 RepID=UPI0028C4E010|nr:uncharacterized protein LOC132379744 [Hypanus sabinus]
MDPADPGHWRAALEQQEVMLGRHQNQLDSVFRAVESLSANSADLVAQTQSLQLSQSAHQHSVTVSSAPPSASSHALPIQEPHSPPPEKYSAFFLKTLTWSYTLTLVLCGNGTRSQGLTTGHFSICQGHGLKDQRAFRVPDFLWLWRRVDSRSQKTRASWEVEDRKRRDGCWPCAQRPEMFRSRAWKNRHNKLASCFVISPCSL